MIMIINQRLILSMNTMKDNRLFNDFVNRHAREKYEKQMEWHSQFSNIFISHRLERVSVLFFVLEKKSDFDRNANIER